MPTQLHLPRTGLVSAAMPRAIEPMKTLYGPLPQDENNYGFEYKWDGVRAIYFWNGVSVYLQSRNILDITTQYPELSPMGQTLGETPCVFDGEIIALDQHGHASFNVLQHRFGISDPAEALKRSRHIPVIYMIFDVLYVDQYLLFDVPYQQRRAFLDTLDLSGPAWQVPPWQIGNGEEMIEAADNMHLEGVVAKRLDSPYEPGRRSGAWVKTKLVNQQEFVIGGWTLLKGEDPTMIGSLLVGYWDKGRFIYAGSVGTGFTDEDRRKLRELLEPLRLPASPFYGSRPRSDAIYADPQLVGEIEFRGWTGQDILRQPSFKGLRPDINPAEVTREDRP
jgi:bifunctional non-homologous end joining protein LigD